MNITSNGVIQRETWSLIYEIFMQLLRDSREPSKIKEVSSAYCEIRNSTLHIVIPLMTS